MPLHLHIFEDRYKQMVDECLNSDRKFGVVLIRSGVEALGPLPEPYQVGCEARIVEMAPLGEGRMNIVIVGRERFRIHSLDRSTKPYLVGEVELYPLVVGTPNRSPEAVAHFRHRLERYVHLLMQLSEAQNEPEPLPSELEPLMHMAAFLLQVPIEEKQAFLETQDAGELFASLDSVIDRELALVRAMLGESSRSGIGVFSRN